MKRISAVDSHTGGEPTRVVVAGGPELGRASMGERRERLRVEHDAFRSAVVNEPRGSDVLVGALLCEPESSDSVAGVIFFNNVGYLAMCGHGTIGVVATLAHLGRVAPGRHRIDTPAGAVTAELHGDGRVTVANVPSYRWRAGVSVDVAGHGRVTGDVAWGGNWFFLVETPDRVIQLQDVEALTEFAWRVRQALPAAGVTGAGGAEIDHIELSAPSRVAGLDSRNFVLCPGKAYDRSPCGTGTCAKLACLHADGKLRPGQLWRQESVTGSVFEGSYRLDDSQPGRVLPEITGRAFITGELTLLLADDDPFRWGIRESAWRGTI
jgi:4-hydroxyproline epimerase